MLSGTPTRNVGVTMLCRVPGATGALTPTFNPHAHAASIAPSRPPAVVGVDRDELPSSPGGGVVGSVGSGEPMAVLAHRDGWRRVATQFGAKGWVRAADLCG
jgi:hypothetical protein